MSPDPFLRADMCFGDNAAPADVDGDAAVDFLESASVAVRMVGMLVAGRDELPCSWVGVQRTCTGQQSSCCGRLVRPVPRRPGGGRGTRAARRKPQRSRHRPRAPRRRRRHRGSSKSCPGRPSRTGTNPADFEAYQAQFPDGDFRVPAQNRLTTLGSPAGNPAAADGTRVAAGRARRASVTRPNRPGLSRRTPEAQSIDGFPIIRRWGRGPDQRVRRRWRYRAHRRSHGLSPSRRPCVPPLASSVRTCR